MSCRLAEAEVVAYLVFLLLFYLSLSKVPINGKWVNLGLNGRQGSVITTHEPHPPPAVIISVAKLHFYPL